MSLLASSGLLSDLIKLGMRLSNQAAFHLQERPSDSPWAALVDALLSPAPGPHAVPARDTSTLRTMHQRLTKARPSTTWAPEDAFSPQAPFPMHSLLNQNWGRCICLMLPQLHFYTPAVSEAENTIFMASILGTQEMIRIQGVFKKSRDSTNNQCLFPEVSR